MTVPHTQGGFSFVHSPVPRLLPRERAVQDQSGDDGPSDTDSESKLQFVNVGTFDESKSLKTRKIVRGHVMKRVRKAQRDLRVQRQLAAHAENNPTPLSVVLGGGQVDPFINYPIEMKPYMHRVVAHYLNIFVSAHLPFHASENGDNPLIKTYFPTILTSSALLHGVLCIASAHLDVLHGRDSSAAHTLAYRGEAIRLIREGFQSPDQGISDGAIGAIIPLSGHEIFFGDKVAFDCHMQGLYRMVAMRGGLDNLGMNGVLKTMILWADQYRTLYMRTQPHYKFAQNHRAYRFRNKRSPADADSQQPAHVLEEVSLDFDDNCGVGFKDANAQGLLPPAFLSNLEAICLIAHLGDLGTDEETSGSQMEDLVGKLDFLETQLTPCRFHDPLPGSYEQCCSIAANVYNNMIFRNFPSDSSVQLGLLQQLRKALEDSDMDNAWAQNLEMLHWILFAASAVAHGNPVRSWFRKELRGFTSRIRVILGMSWKDMKRMLQKFLWSDTFCEDAGRGLWQEMLDGQCINSK